MKQSIIGLLFVAVLLLIPTTSHAQLAAGGRVIVGTPCSNGAIHVKFIPAGGYLYPVIYQKGVTIPFSISPQLLLKPGTQFLGAVYPKAWTCTTPKGGILKGLLLQTVGTSL